MSWMIVELEVNLSSLTPCTRCGAMTNQRMLFPEPAINGDNNQGFSNKSEKGIRLP